MAVAAKVVAATVERVVTEKMDVEIRFI